MRSTGATRSHERGFTLALVALSLMALLGVGALAVDLSMLMDARAEAQRAADAAALAGASAFQQMSGLPEATPEAFTRAFNYAAANTVYGKAIDVGGAKAPVVKNFPADRFTVTTVEANEVTVQLVRGWEPGPGDSNRVRVWVRPAEIPTFFARTLGMGLRGVQAMATAHASTQASKTTCMKPFLLPDTWHEANTTQQDYNPANGLMDGTLASKDGGEKWYYEPDKGDYYVRYGDEIPSGQTCTGYGCGRAGYASDYGTPLLIKPQQGNAQRQGNWYYTIDGEEDNLRDQIKFGCVDAEIGGTPEPEQGGKTGQAKQGMEYLVNQDPSAHWDEATKTIVGSDPKFGGWENSPRTVIVGLFDPKYMIGVSSTNEKIPPGAVYDNFVRVWIEEVESNQDNIMVRFMGFAPGAGGGEEGGSIVLRLQLIQ